MKPQDPALAAAQRESLKAQYSALLDEGVANLNQALLIDPNYSDAMAYLNLLIRERADLRDTKKEYADIASPTSGQKALDAKKSQTVSGLAPPPPPPPLRQRRRPAGRRLRRVFESAVRRSREPDHEG